MTMAAFNFVVQDVMGNALNAAQVTICRETDNGVATIYSDIGGLTPQTNPITTGTNGTVLFYTQAGSYSITAVHASGTRTWRHVQVGAADGGAIIANIIINGDFQINQRAFAGGALSAGDYGFDRWKAAAGGANISVSGYVVTLTSGGIEQVIEPGVWAVGSLASQDITVSVESPSADITVTLGSQSGTIVAGSGRRSVTLGMGSGDTGNLTLKLNKASGSGVTFERVLAERASAVGSWLPRPLTAEMLLCQRYFVQYNFSGTNTRICIMQAWNSSSAFGKAIDLPTPMRATPTSAVSAASDFGPFVGGSIGTAFSTFSAVNTRESLAVDFGGSSGLTTNGAHQLGNSSTSAWMSASAEL